MKTLSLVALIAALTGLDTRIAAVILIPVVVGRWMTRSLHATVVAKRATAQRVRDRLRVFWPPKGPRVRPPRFA
jgi:hypothetical protein